jgi:hypothetical protein
MNTAQAETLFQWLLKEEDCENDDRRFFCSYLIAHTSLSMANESEDNFLDIMHDSLASALQADKLSEQDKQGINDLWEEACKQAA